jgi:hypothetical protein
MSIPANTSLIFFWASAGSGKIGRGGSATQTPLRLAIA